MLPARPQSMPPDRPPSPRPARTSYGPFEADLSPAERDARLRVLRAIVGLIVGSGHTAVAALRRAEADPDALAEAHAALEALPTRTLRRILATYAAQIAPQKPSSGPQSGEDAARRPTPTCGRGSRSDAREGRRDG